MFKRILKYLYFFLENFGALISAIVFILLLAQVIFRFTNTVVPWTENIARAFLIWLTFIGAAVVQYEKDHIRAEFLPEFIQRLNKRFYWLYEVIIDLLTVFFIIIALIGAYEMFRTMDYIGLAAVPKFKVAYLYLAQLIGFGAMVLFIILQVANKLKKYFIK
ncbi:MAG: TRAP transporter small permease subunit [Halanaerobiales bacterium]|nr:TRAP transporter small permease subunit [Halanaerobiales bacterium]